MRFRCLPIVIGLLLMPVCVSAQTTVNPTKAIFTASPDHSTVVNGVAVVDSYRLDTYIFTTQLGALAFNKNLGKPTPAANGDITAAIPEFSALPSSGYEAFVSAIGPGGETRSAASDPFVRLGPPRAPGKPAAVP